MKQIVIYVCCLLTPIVAIGGSFGLPHWSSLHFTEQTHVGRVSVSAEATSEPRTLAKLDIRVNGRRLALPRLKFSDIPNPHLHQVDLRWVATRMCVNDFCGPDWPAKLTIPFGDITYRDETQSENLCEQSELIIEFFADRLHGISIDTCAEDGSSTRVVYGERFSP